MKPDRDPHQRLIDDAMHETWATGPEAGFARQAAQVARRRRAVRGALLAGSAAAVMAAATVFLRPAPQQPPVPVATAKPAYELISDEQLLLALADRPVLILPDEPGGKRIVLLHR